MREWCSLLVLSLALISTAEAEGDAEAKSQPASPGHGAGAEAEAEEDTSDEITEEDGVLVLTAHNFERALNENQFLLVEFYTKWCGHCKAFAPEYAKAAGQLNNVSSEIKLGKVEILQQKELGSEFRIQSYPTLMFFKEHNRQAPIEYTGKRNAKGIISWLKRRIGPSAVILDSVAEAEMFVHSADVVIVGFLKDIEDDASRVYSEVANDIVEIPFALTNNAKVWKVYGISRNTIAMFKKFDDHRAELVIDDDDEAGLDKAELSKFIKINQMELVTEFTEENNAKIFDAKIENHILLFINKTTEDHSRLLEHFRRAAGAFRGKVLFVFIDITGEIDHVLGYFSVKKQDAPAIRFINIENLKKYRFPYDDITTENVKSFCQDAIEGNIEVYRKSEDIPEDWDKNPVKVLVGKNFDQVAFDETKNVLVEFYAPWCGHCKELAPIWEQLGERYKDHESIVIAKMDSTLNEVASVSIKGYPSIRYFPAGSERKVLDYDESRDLETFTTFLDNGGVMPQVDVDEDDEEDDDDEDDKDLDDGDVLNGRNNRTTEGHSAEEPLSGEDRKDEL